MWNRAAKLRFRRKFRMQKRQVTTAGEQLEQHLDKHFFRRLDHVVPVRRFVLAWTTLLTLAIFAVSVQALTLGNFYQTLRPAAGGTYTEGMVGAFTNANPLYASSLADRTVSRLVFSGLLKHDTTNALVGDLAQRWSVNDDGTVYTVRLRENLRWHDGTRLTADDVVFTYQTIQNADAQSVLRESWLGVEVKRVDDRTVTFTLANPLVSFEHSLTNGIIPRHILDTVPVVDLRASQFNTDRPIGSGPFQWQGIQVRGDKSQESEIRVALTKNAAYHLGEPKLNNFTVRVFGTRERLIEVYNNRELNAVSGFLTPPRELAVAYDTLLFPQTAATMTFFKTTEGVLSDKKVRQALVRGVETSEVRRTLDFPGTRVDGPILRGQLGYNAELTQLSYDPEAAAKLLDDAGWRLADGSDIRQKDGAPLEFSLYAERNSEAERITRELARQWRAVGVDAKIVLQENDEFRLTLSSHGYDALLRGISIGPDPDVYVFWHSSQADVRSGGRLNFSEYKSDTVDEALESARTRTDPELRAEKYQPLLRAWRDDAPALGLYQPNSLYIVRSTVYELTPHPVNDSTDRFANVNEWMIRREKTTVD